MRMDDLSTYMTLESNKSFENHWGVLAGEAVQEKHLKLAEPWLEAGRLTYGTGADCLQLP